VIADDEMAWTLRVVAAELMTNTFKSTFCDGARRVIGVAPREEAGSVLLTVADNAWASRGPSRF
jgi:two-component sensor histidine kinase